MAHSDFQDTAPGCRLLAVGIAGLARASHMVAVVDMGSGFDRRAQSGYAGSHHVVADHIDLTAESRMSGQVRPDHSQDTVDVVAADHRTVVEEDSRLGCTVAAAGCSLADRMMELEELRSRLGLAGLGDIDCSSYCS